MSLDLKLAANFSKNLITAAFIIRHQAIWKSNPALFQLNLKKYLEIEKMRQIVLQYCKAHGFSQILVTDDFLARHYATWIEDALYFENNLKSYLQIEAMAHAHLTPLFDAPFFLDNDEMIDSTTNQVYRLSESMIHTKKSKNLTDFLSNNQNASPLTDTASESDMTDDLMKNNSTNQSSGFLLFSTEQLANDSVVLNASLFATNPKKRNITDVLYEENGNSPIFCASHV